jgi:hypothetical protein
LPPFPSLEEIISLYTFTSWGHNALKLGHSPRWLGNYVPGNEEAEEFIEKGEGNTDVDGMGEMDI